MVWFIWLIIAFVLAIIEMLVVDLTLLMLAGGALAATATSLMTDSLSIQVIVFAIVSVILLFTVRPWAKSLIANSSPETRTNAEALIGLSVEALTDVTDRGGRVKLDGQEWSARTTGSIIPAGANARVSKIDGAFAIIEP